MPRGDGGPADRGLVQVGYRGPWFRPDWAQQAAQYVIDTTPFDPGTPSSSSPSFEMPSFDFPDFSEQLASLEQARLQAAVEARRQSNYSTIDQLWSDRGAAVSSAIGEVDKRIGLESDRARLVGLDFSITDEQRTSRIENLFAELFSQEQEDQLGALVGEFGDPSQSNKQRLAIETGGRPYEGTFLVNRGTITGADSTSGGEGPGSGPAAGGAVDQRGRLSEGILGLLQDENQQNLLGV